jgi:hypothetical protein
VFNNAIIQIKNDSVLVTYIDPNNDSKPASMLITLHDFIETVKAADTKIETPFFSTNVFKYKLDGSYETLSVFSPPTRCTLKYDGYNGIEVFENAFMPSFYMDIVFTTSGRYSGSSIRMLKDKHSVLEMNRSFDSHPMIFPNVYDGSNKICWGRTLDDVNITRETAGNLADIFKSSIFNNDLFSHNLSRISAVVPSIVETRDFFQWLTTVDELPDALYF